MRYVVSPYESDSDAQRAFLISKGFADFAMLDYSMHVTLMQTFILRKIFFSDVVLCVLQVAETSQNGHGKCTRQVALWIYPDLSDGMFFSIC